MFEGVLPAVITPFQRNLSMDLDLPGLASNIEFLVENGVHGIVPCGSTGESATLSFEEHETVIEKTIEVVSGRVPVFAGVSTATLEESISLARHAEANGAAGILAQAPQTVAADPIGLQDFFHRLAGSTSLTLMIQDLDWQGGGMPLDLICQLFEEVPTFRCIKVETVPAGPKYSRILAVTGISVWVTPWRFSRSIWTASLKARATPWT